MNRAFLLAFIAVILGDETRSGRIVNCQAQTHLQQTSRLPSSHMADISSGARDSTPQKLGEFVTVTDFGADPSGARDSTAAFTKSLSSACPVAVRIPAGTYLITHQLTISCIGTNLIGDGPRVTWLRFNPSPPQPRLLSS